MSYEFQKGIRCDLVNGFTRRELSIDCSRVDIINASSLNAVVTLALTLEDGRIIEDIELQKTGYYESPLQIKRVTMDAAAQSGEWVELRFSHTPTPPERFGYKRGADDALSAIGTVDVVTAVTLVDAVTEITEPVVTRSGQTIDHAAVTVGTTAAQIVAADADRTRITIMNNSASIIYVGKDNAVTTSNGLPVVGGGAVTLETGAAVWGISSSAGNDIRYLVEKK